MNDTVGTCSLCGGRVSVPRNWMATTPPIPTCESCGATKKQPHGDVVEMNPLPRKIHEPAKFTHRNYDPVPWPNAIGCSSWPECKCSSPCHS